MNFGRERREKRREKSKAGRRKAGKTDTNFLTCEKNRIRLLIGHTIFFTSEKNRMTNEIASHERETTFIR